MQPIEPVLRAVDYFERHLRAPALVAEAAEAAGYSLFHFCRVFNQVTSLTPFEYLMRRRLSEAAKDLTEQETRVLDIAVDFQFGSAEAFARAFKRMFEVQPNLARRTRYDARRAMPRLDADYLHFLERQKPDPYPVDLTALCLAGLMTIEEGWGLPSETLSTALFAETGQQANEPLWAVIYPSTGQEETRSLTFLGVPFDGLIAQPSALARKDLPAASAFCFSWPDNTQDQHFLLQYLYHTWAPHQNLNIRLVLLRGASSSQGQPRSEERRVGKECRSRWSPYH